MLLFFLLLLTLFDFRLRDEINGQNNVRTMIMIMMQILNASAMIENLFTLRLAIDDVFCECGNFPRLFLRSNEQLIKNKFGLNLAAVYLYS